jgi:predicted SprT family Zn-dependent metalloprotease
LEITIPKQFNLQGQTITVEWDDNLTHTMDAHGIAAFRENKLKLQKPTAKPTLPLDKIEHIYYHELVHFILNAMSQSELAHDEGFVDNFAGLLHQAIKTSKGVLK